MNQSLAGKAYVADSVHEIFSELQIAQAENAKLQNELAGVAAENRVLREQLTELRAMYEEKSADCASFYTILQQTASSIGAGVQRMQRQKAGRTMVQQERQAAREEPEVAEEQPRADVPPEVAAFAPRPQRKPLEEEAREMRPQFLRSPAPQPVGPDDPRLPPVRPTPRSAEDVLVEMEHVLGDHREEQARG